MGWAKYLEVGRLELPLYSLIKRGGVDTTGDVDTLAQLRNVLRCTLA